MSFKGILGRVFVCLILQIGIYGGARIPPEEIEQLMKMSQPRVVQTVPSGEGKDPEDELAV